jgi:hypothetical protein
MKHKVMFSMSLQEPEAQDDKFVSGDPAHALSKQPREQFDYSRSDDASTLAVRATTRSRTDSYRCRRSRKLRTTTL